MVWPSTPDCAPAFPARFSGGEYMNLSIGIGVTQSGFCRCAGIKAGTLVSALDDGTLIIETGPAGDLTLTISGGTPYDRAYTEDVDGTPLSVSSLPQCLRAPVLAGDGTPAAGETLTVTPGLWIYTDMAPTLTYSTNGTNAVDATTDPAAPRLLVGLADATETLTVTEMAGGKTATSNGVSIAVLSFSDDFEAYGITPLADTEVYTITGSGADIDVVSGAVVSGSDTRRYAAPPGIVMSSKFEITARLGAAGVDDWKTSLFLLARFVDSTQFIGVRVQAGRPKFSKDGFGDVNGSGYGSALSGGETLKLAVDGTSMTLYVNGSPVLSETGVTELETYAAAPAAFGWHNSGSAIVATLDSFAAEDVA